MASMDLKTEPMEDPLGCLSVHQVCRLCLSEESLVDIFEEEFWIQWVVDFLTITISKEDGMSIFVCAICRIRLTEFHQFRIRCHEVQDVLKSMIHSRCNDDVETSEKERGASPMQCNICSKFFDTKQQLNAHNRLHGVKKYKCTYCDKAFVIRQHFDKHVQTHTKSMNTIQDTITPNKTSDLNRKHVEQQIEPELLIPCNICHKPLQSKQALWHHKRKVHGPKNFECAMCNVGFPFLNNLKKHMKTNSHQNRIKFHGKDLVLKKEEENHECPDCKRKFEHPSQLERHVKTHQPKKLQLPCDICFKLYDDKRKLWMHKKCHRPKKYVCPICERPFTDPLFLKNHIPTHEPNRARQRTRQVTLARNETGPYKCDMCRNRYRMKHALNRHKKLAHGPKMHKCHMCEKTFTTRNEMMKHIRAQYQKNDRGLQSLHVTQRIESSTDETLETIIDIISEPEQKPNLSPTNTHLN